MNAWCNTSPRYGRQCALAAIDAIVERMREAAWKPAGYVPTADQRGAHGGPIRFKLVAGGERAGKSRSAAMELVWRLRVGGLYWIVGPDYEQCRPELGYVVDLLARVGDVEKLSMPAQGSCRLETKTGAVVVTKSAMHPEKLAGEAPDGILLCEAAQCGYEVFLRLRGRVAEKRGWMWISGTFEGSRGWYAEKFRSWQVQNREGGVAFSFPSWRSTALFPLGEEDPEIRALRAAYPEDLYRERLGGTPCPPASLVFREFDPGAHVKECPFDGSAKVELAIDPGYAGAYAVLAIQRAGPVVKLVDEVYLHRKVAAEVIAECKARPWWRAVTGGVMDVAGAQHHAMPSHMEIWLAETGLFLRSSRVGILDGIDRLRTFLWDPASDEPLLLVDPRCAKTIAEFGSYRYRDVQDGQPIHEAPIDRDNHALKALGYWLFNTFGPVKREIRRSVEFRMAG